MAIKNRGRIYQEKFIFGQPNTDTQLHYTDSPSFTACCRAKLPNVDTLLTFFSLVMKGLSLKNERIYCQENFVDYLKCIELIIFDFPILTLFSKNGHKLGLNQPKHIFHYSIES